jgi:hypothetical protein
MTSIALWVSSMAAMASLSRAFSACCLACSRCFNMPGWAYAVRARVAGGALAGVLGAVCDDAELTIGVIPTVGQSSPTTLAGGSSQRFDSLSTIPERRSLFSGHPRCPCAIDTKTLSANDRYLTRDGKPWFPVMGEFHYSRYPETQWEKEILKMKAGGIEVVSTYVFPRRNRRAIRLDRPARSPSLYRAVCQARSLRLGESGAFGTMAKSAMEGFPTG